MRRFNRRHQSRTNGNDHYEYVATGRERVYCRILCCCMTWERGPRPYREPPPEIIAARKSNFRHGADEPKKKARGSRIAPAVVDAPDHPRRPSRGRPSSRAPDHARHGHGDDPLSRARRLDCYADFVNGVDGDGRRDNGTAALFAASHVGDVELMEALAAAGLFIDAKGQRDETALIVAARAGKLEACEWLFDKGANMAAADVAGRNAADHARFAGHHDVAEVLHQYGCPSVEVID